MTDLQLPLTFLHRPAAAGTPAPWLLVLMHGLNSHEEDLFALAHRMPPRFHVLSLRAPYETLPGMAYAWFDVQMLPDGGRRIDELQARDSRFLVGELVASAATQLGIPPERVVLGGFSQGAMMALSVLLTRPAVLRAAMVWHGRLLPGLQADIAPPEAFAGRALWVSHGSADDVIPPAAAQDVREFAAGLRLALAGHDDPVAHTIGEGELQGSVDWLQSLA